MPTFNVRIDDGNGPDEGEPIEFPDSATARHDAQVAMGELAREKIPGSQRAHLAIDIEDNSGEAVYRGEMDFQGRDGCAAEPADDVASQLPKGPRE